MAGVSPVTRFPDPTCDGRVLSKEQKEFYDKNGYIILRNVVPQEKLDKYGARFQSICDGSVRIPGMVVMKDISFRMKNGEKAINKIQDFQIDEELFDYCQLPQVVSVIQDLIGENVLSMHTMLINKPPDSGSKTSRHPMHQDLHYFPFRPADRIACAWTAMEKIHRGNGCLVVVPGSHKDGRLHVHEYPKWEGGVNKMYHGIQDYDPSAPRVYAEMEAGDTIFFHPLVVHGSGANKTKGFRKAISCHYGAGECHYIDVKGTSQENIANEVDSIVKKRLGEGAEVSYQDVWKFRARLVAGVRSTL
jgi:phytanoyl-CoA hydroxylase